MDYTTFRASLSAENPPAGLSPALEALWYAGQKAWDTAHLRIQSADDRASAWVHAYLHRWEGDAANAAYWYRRAGKTVAQGTLDDEWESLVQALLTEST